MSRPYTWDLHPSGGTLGNVPTLDAAGKYVPAAPASSYADPLTTKGDLVGRSASATGRVAVGTNGYALLADSTATFGVTWTDLGGIYIPKSLADAKGDLFVGTADNTVARKAVGADGTFLKADSAQSDGLAWGSVLADPTTTKGDIIARTSSALTRRAVGSNGQVLTADSAETDGVKWATPSAGSGIAEFLRPSAFTGTQDDDFAAASLDAKWTRVTYVSGDETYQQGGGSWLKVAPRAAGAYYYQTAPAGDYTITMSAIVNRANGTDHMFGIIAVDNSSNGLGGGWYNGANPDGGIVGGVTAGVYNASFFGAPDTAGQGKHAGAGRRTWYRLRKSSTSWFASLSANGIFWGPETAAFTKSGVTRIGFGSFLGTLQGCYIDWFSVA